MHLKRQQKQWRMCLLLGAICLLFIQGCAGHNYGGGAAKPSVESLKADPSKMTPEQKALYTREMQQMQQKMQGVNSPQTKTTP